jgi:putative transposase
MSGGMYQWRRMSPEQREETLRARQLERRPWHSPPHRDSNDGRYLLSAACYEHRPVIGVTPERLAAFEERLISVCRSTSELVTAWVVLPNHYHVLLHTPAVHDVLQQVGRLHGRTAHDWNQEDDARGRQVWCGACETAMKSDGHYWATVNYVHHNPVKHGYVERWQDWPFGNAREYLDAVGRDEAERLWRDYPVLGYGDGWDVG